MSNNFEISFVRQIYNWFFTPSPTGDDDSSKKSRPSTYGAAADEELIVKFRSEESPSGIDSLSQKHGLAQIEGLFEHSEPNKHLAGVYRFRLPQGKDQAKLLEELRGDPRVEYAQPNYRRYPCETIPNDVLFSQQWALTRIQAPQAWDIEVGDPGLIIAVIDSGIDYNNPELAPRLWVNAGEIAGNSVDDDGNGYIDDKRGWNFSISGSGSNDVLDVDGHGTSVAGIIGAATDNGTGISGINWTSKIMAVKTDLYDSSSAQAVKYAVDNGAKIINMSWGWYSDSPLLEEAITYAYSRGAILVAAAGNFGFDMPFYPAAFKNVIAAAATDEADGRAGWYYDSSSNYGSWLSLSAPGKNVVSTILGNSFGPFAGTSAASPIVSGVASLALSLYPDYSNEEIKQLLIKASDDIGSAGWDSFSGYGRINLYDALTLPSSGYQPSSAVITSPVQHQFISAPAPIEIYGSASSRDFSYYVIEYGTGDNPISWSGASIVLQNNGMAPVNNDLLGTFDAATLGTNFISLRLRTFDLQGNWAEDRISFYRDDMLKFARNYSTSGQSMIVGADLDNDGKVELAINGKDSLALIGADGNVREGWPKYEADYIFAGPAIGDIDNDGELEVVAAAASVAGSGGKLFAWKQNGEALPGWPKQINDIYAFEALSGPISLLDINDDGKLEIIISIDAGRILALDDQGNEVAGWPKQLGNRAPAFAAIETEGVRKIVVGSEKNIQILDAQGNPLPGWPKSVDFEVMNLIVADLDNDGAQEIIAAGSFDESYKKIAVFDHAGNMKAGWPAVFSGFQESIPALSAGDIDNDGMVEILVNSFEFDATAMRCLKGELTVYGPAGDLKSGWPKENLNDCSNNSLLVSDINGDGLNEIIYPAFSRKVFVWNPDGSPVPNWPRYTRGINYGAAVFDSDGNGKKEIMLAAFSPAAEKQELYVWESPTQSLTVSPWPMSRHDPYNSGNLNTDLIPPAIYHDPVATAESDLPVPISALITDDVEVKTARIFYRNSLSGIFQSILMSGSGNDSWQGSIPGSAAVKEGIQYYITAHDRSINPAVTPVYDITVTEGPKDTNPPTISFDPVTEGMVGIEQLITADVTDDISGVQNVWLSYRHKKYGDKKVDFQQREGSYYSAYIPAGDMLEGGITYSIGARDNDGNETQTANYSLKVIKYQKSYGCGCN